ncbi:MAG: cell surface protein SprA [Chitinophagaceae bacterium]|nr:cell surface protein SprA [Chitinophagaceae bacterium]
MSHLAGLIRRVKKDSVRTNLFKGGRNTQFAQDAGISYTLPTQKIPFLDWTNIRAAYNTKYNWLASSLLARSLGNTLSNTQTRTINGEFNFDQLYNKSRFLRAANSGGSQQQSPLNPRTQSNRPGGDSLSKSTTPVIADSVWAKMTKKEKRAFRKAERKRKREERRRDKELRKNQPVQMGNGVKSVIGLATSLKRIGVQYSQDFGTMLPGYMDSTVLLGNNWKSREPGLGFIFGYQPDTSWINRFGAKGLLSRDSLVSAMIQQRYSERLNVTAQLIPARDFNIDINLDKSFSKQYSELLKDTTGNAGLARLNPYAMGSFSISYISYQTLFEKFDPNVVSETFKKFENNRTILSERLAKLNGYQNGQLDPNDPGYYEGYGRYAQDVVIPSFLAAYTSKDPSSIKLFKNSNPNIRSNPFKGLFPKPNWTLTYTGLSRIPGLDKIFTNFTIRHGYHSTLAMNSFNTALLFADPNRIGYPYFRDTLTGNYIPYFLVPNLTIQESFDPLFELDMTFTNQLSTRF